MTKLSRKSISKRWRQISSIGNFTDDYEVLFAVCEIVAKRKKIKLIKPQAALRSGDLFEFIHQIAESTDIRLRQISLAQQWWLKDAGPLIGFYQNEPCALLPRKMGGYQLIDVKSNRKIIVSAAMAGQLSTVAFQFYSPLPAKISQIKDLFQFSLNHIKTDCWFFITLQFLISFFTVAIPISLGILFNVVFPNRDLSLLWQVIVLLFINICVITLFHVTQTSALIRLRIKLEAIMTPAIWDHILKFPVRFFRRFSAGDLLFRTGVITDIQKSLIQSWLLLTSHALTLVLSLILLFFYSLQLTAITLGLGLLILVLASLINYQQLRLMRRLYYHFGQFIGYVLEVITGITKIRIADATARVFNLWSARLAQRSETELRMKFHQLKLDTFIAFMTLGSPLILFAVSERLKPALAFGNFVAFTAIFVLFLLTLFRMIADLEEAGRMAPLWKKSRIILTSKIERESGSIDPGELNGEITLKNIFFRYHDNDQPIFKDFSLSIRPGEFIAIVGPSGSGKSTLFRLILGFEEPEAGEVSYNGVSLRILKLTAVRRQIGAAIQSSTLIPGTIFANIAGNSTRMTRVEAWEIAEKVGLSEFIKNLPMQMDTLITEGAITLSGGEAQRIVLARALAQKPKILVLDEATSALDNTTQAVVHNYLKQLQATQIIAAHRLSTIINADRIVVMDKGKIVQSGTFTELMSAPGLFSRMARRQLQ